MLSLKPCGCKLVLCRYAFSSCACDRRCSIRGTAGNLIISHLALETVWQPHNDHSLMEERDMEAEDGGFLSAMLGGRTCKDTSYFAHQCSLSPELPGSVEELAHLPAHIAEPRGCAKDDCVSSRQLIHRADRDVGHGFLGLDRPHFFQHLSGECLRHSAQDHFGVWNLARPFGYGLRQTCEYARTLNSKRSKLSSPIPPDRVGTMLPCSGVRGPPRNLLLQVGFSISLFFTAWSHCTPTPCRREHR